MSFWGKIFGVEKNPGYEKGICYFNEGKYEFAAEEFERVIDNSGKNDPVHALALFYAAESHVHLGTSLFHGEKLDEALRHFREALDENPTYPDLYYRMGVIHHRLGTPEESISMLRKAIELNNRYFEAICYLGIVLYEKGERKDADELFKRALEIGVDTPSPISKFLSTHLSGRETDIPPLSSLKELISLDTDFDSCMKGGLESFNTGNYDRAVQYFRRAVEVHPDYADIRFKLGLSYLKRGNHEEARVELEEALAINPEYTEARFYLGIVFLDRKNYREALTHFENAVSQKPDYADLHCFLGATSFYLGDLARAKEVLERAMELSPQYSMAQYYYGLLLYTMGDRRNAIEYLSGAMKCGAEGYNTSISLALVHLREGNLEEAMVVLKEILDAGPESADVLYFIGEVYLRMDKLEEAEAFFRKSLEANPDFLRAKEKIAHILLKRGDYDGAEDVLGTPGREFADLYKIMGDIKFYKDDLDAAEDLYRKSLRVNTEYGEASLSLAMTLRKKGQDGDAERIIRRMIELDPGNVLARSLLGRGPLDLDAGRSQ